MTEENLTTSTLTVGKRKYDFGGVSFWIFSILVEGLGDFWARNRNLREISSPEPAGNV